MCFSATASFVTAGIVGAAGVLSLTRVTRPRDLVLAATPLLFAIQQSIEGLLWLRLPDPHDVATAPLALAFLAFAQVLWPLYAPAAVMLAEPDPRRRRRIAPWLALGLGVGAYLLWGLLTRSHSAEIVGDHIAYDLGRKPSRLVAVAYLAAVSVPSLLSSQRTILLLGAIILAGSVLAYVSYFQTFQSVWCYFAAAGSAVILAHFQWVGLRSPIAPAPAPS